MKSVFHRSILALATIGIVAAAGFASAQQQAQKDRPLKKYESGTKDFWAHPPDDWFLGDETEAQKGLAPPTGPATGASQAELDALVKKIKLPPGFKIEVWAPGVLQATRAPCSSAPSTSATSMPSPRRTASERSRRF
jgi:hypothetical protein